MYRDEIRNNLLNDYLENKDKNFEKHYQLIKRNNLGINEFFIGVNKPIDLRTIKLNDNLLTYVDVFNVEDLSCQRYMCGNYKKLSDLSNLTGKRISEKNDLYVIEFHDENILPRIKELSKDMILKLMLKLQTQNESLKLLEDDISFFKVNFLEDSEEINKIIYNNKEKFDNKWVMNNINNIKYENNNNKDINYYYLNKEYFEEKEKVSDSLTDIINNNKEFKKNDMHEITIEDIEK